MGFYTLFALKQAIYELTARITGHCAVQICSDTQQHVILFKNDCLLEILTSLSWGRTDFKSHQTKGHNISD